MQVRNFTCEKKVIPGRFPGDDCAAIVIISYMPNRSEYCEGHRVQRSFHPLSRGSDQFQQDTASSFETVTPISRYRSIRALVPECLPSTR
jgi:hypothetical protein